MASHTPSSPDQSPYQPLANSPISTLSSAPSLPTFPSAAAVAPQKAKHLLSLPSHYYTQYTTFVRSNSQEITRFESLLRNLILFLPSHSSQSSAQLSTEAAHTLLTLLTSVHTSILAPNVGDEGYRPLPGERWQSWARGESAGVVQQQQQQQRGVMGRRRGWKGSVYRKAYGLLRLVQYMQLLMEMLAKKAGEGVRWRVVVMLESVKAVCRFIMLRFSGDRTVVGTEVGGGEQVRKTEDEEGESGQQVDGWKMPRTGTVMPKLPNLEAGDTVMGFLEQRMVTPDDVKAAQNLVRKLQGVRAQAAEVLWILRPVIYALALQRVQGNRRDWRPWIVGIGMEVLSRQMSKRDIRETVPGGLRGLSVVEKEELGRRGANLAWWGMRGAFHENITGPWIKSVVQKLKGKPLLSIVGTVAEDYEWLWEEYYYSTATV